MDYSCCSLCPNFCRVNRTTGQIGRCGQTNTPRISWSGLHKGEEPPIKGEKGSGMIFFCGCPLHCQYCQNYQISGSHNNDLGIEVTEEQLG
ncbi:MAG: radical SAM protein, partial [Sphaerochaetaceae bacterium]|nr:radical SAM protein [Sphaerochaetaceae bacterium]